MIKLLVPFRYWSRRVIPNVGRRPHRWGMTLFWWVMGRTCTLRLTIPKTMGYFSLQIDESTLRDSEVVLLVYARYIGKGEFAEEMEFYKLLETITSTADIYVTDAAVLVVVNHLKIRASDFKEQFSDFKQIDFPTWVTQLMLVEISHISMQYQEELSEMQNDESVKTLFNIKGVMAWLCDETETKYPHSTKSAGKWLLRFPSSYLAECGFSAVNDLLSKKRNRLDITKRGDLRLMLTKLESLI
ncbi:uncharacterized protein TNCV_2267931 [Trichonephila clavipes]|nr:uncharacterized protein TNCV_2267931 [Trichonephila clavipes]